jgi:hypothetical protein
LVGDSWAYFVWENRSLGNTFSAHGHPEILEEGTTTTIPGTTAADWTDPVELQKITDALAANPEIEIVQLTLGGNDFLEGAPDGWYVGILDPTALAERIGKDIERVLDHISKLNPDLEILVSLYDYLNYEDYDSVFGALYCDEQFQAMGAPETPVLNDAVVVFSSYLEQTLFGRPRVEVRSHWGLMQYLFGFPDAIPPIPPGSLLPPGDPGLPSPIESMLGAGDCIHLSATGYMGVTESLWWTYYRDHFERLLFRDGFESGDLTGWSHVNLFNDRVNATSRLEELGAE